MKAFNKTFENIFNAIELLLTQENIMPALMILYCSIDSISWLTLRNVGQNVVDGERFKNWVKSWMLKYNLPCDEVELYAARNGLVHRQTATSRLTEFKSVRKLVYGLTDTNMLLLEKVIELKNSTDCVCVKISDLVFAFKNGVKDHLQEIEKDVEWKIEFESKCNELLIYIPHQVH